MGAMNNRTMHLKEARYRKKRKLDSANDPTRSANTERQASEEALGRYFEEADSESPSEDDNTDEEGWDMLYGNQKKSTGWDELQRNMQTSARKVSESKGYIGNSERIRFRKNAAFRDATEGCLPLKRLVIHYHRIFKVMGTYDHDLNGVDILKEGCTYVHGAYANATYPSTVGHSWVN
ncbi:hypothetical protein K457DRAFT_1823333 [Linnemannia elongata AG-77]|uniref:Uncharacterized protein n=1 Tax=Linnemannia elongata AG-77 TaxID=1314771 RepID=A0A197JKW0_9FUNG|nr:hypothetical protein K457DRAFT_1823333 [Linnemannia elongata AG-77]